MGLGCRVEDSQLSHVSMASVCKLPHLENVGQHVASKGSCNMWSFTLVANAGVVILSRHLQSSTQEDHPHQSLNKNFALAHGGVLL